MMIRSPSAFASSSMARTAASAASIAVRRSCARDRHSASTSAGRSETTPESLPESLPDSLRDSLRDRSGPGPAAWSSPLEPGETFFRSSSV